MAQASRRSEISPCSPPPSAPEARFSSPRGRSPLGALGGCICRDSASDSFYRMSLVAQPPALLWQGKIMVRGLERSKCRRWNRRRGRGNVSTCHRQRTSTIWHFRAAARRLCSLDHRFARLHLHEPHLWPGKRTQRAPPGLRCGLAASAGRSAHAASKSICPNVESKPVVRNPDPPKAHLIPPACLESPRARPPSKTSCGPWARRSRSK
jgi:hypothetical protein